MLDFFNSYRRALTVATPLGLIIIVLVNFLSPLEADAAQASLRSVVMSSALPSSSAVTYTVTFTPGTSGTIGGLVVDFCADTPLVGSASCTYPAGFSLGSATPGVTNYTGMGTGWTAAAVQGGAGVGSYQTLKLSNTTPQTVSTSSPVSFVISGITNPSTANTSFYARVLTYATSAAMASYTVSGTTRATAPGQVDYGGIGMSTNEAISVTASVQEQLTFCVSGTLLSGTTTCSGATPANLVIGNGATPSVLTTTTPSTATAATQLSTNAGHGVVVRMLNNNSCGGLERAGDGSTCYIAAAGATAFTFSGGNQADFGLNVGASSDGTNGIGTTTVPTAYGTAGQYAMDATSAGNNVTTAPGSQIESVSGGCSLVNTPLTFAAEAGNATPAGIYSATMNLVATGTF